jgi:hypothetical protein
MAKGDGPLYIEKRSDGKFAVERPLADRASAIFETQREAIDWAKTHTSGAVHVERVRMTSGGSRDKWRKS